MAKFSEVEAGQEIFRSDGKILEITPIITYDADYPIVLNDSPVFGDCTRITLDGKYDITDKHPTYFLSKQDCVEYWKGQEEGEGVEFEYLFFNSKEENQSIQNILNCLSIGHTDMAVLKKLFNRYGRPKNKIQT